MTRRVANAEQKMVRFAGQVASRIDAVVQNLKSVADDLPSAEGDFGYFVEATRALLTQRGDGDVLAGVGYAVEYVEASRSPAMVWWVRRGDVVAERSHSVDPDSESFYDYASLRWFRTAVETGAPTLSGPFIDTWGSDDYTVTVSLSVPGDLGTCGVIAADVDVRRLISSLTADLGRITTPLALVNESDRVVVSTVPSLSTGLPILPRAARRDANSISLPRFSVSTYGWSVVSLVG